MWLLSFPTTDNSVGLSSRAPSFNSWFLWMLEESIIPSGGGGFLVSFRVGTGELILSWSIRSSKDVLLDECSEEWPMPCLTPFGNDGALNWDEEVLESGVLANGLRLPDDSFEWIERAWWCSCWCWDESSEAKMEDSRLPRNLEERFSLSIISWNKLGVCTGSRRSMIQSDEANLSLNILAPPMYQTTRHTKGTWPQMFPLLRPFLVIHWVIYWDRFEHTDNLNPEIDLVCKTNGPKLYIDRMPSWNAPVLRCVHKNQWRSLQSDCWELKTLDYLGVLAIRFVCRQLTFSDTGFLMLEAWSTFSH